MPNGTPKKRRIRKAANSVNSSAEPKGIDKSAEAKQSAIEPAKEAVKPLEIEPKPKAPDRPIGPPRPVRRLYGMAHLRDVLHAPDHINDETVMLNAARIIYFAESAHTHRDRACSLKTRLCQYDEQKLASATRTLRAAMDLSSMVTHDQICDDAASYISTRFTEVQPMVGTEFLDELMPTGWGNIAKGRNTGEAMLRAM